MQWYSGTLTCGGEHATGMQMAWVKTLRHPPLLQVHTDCTLISIWKGEACSAGEQEGHDNMYCKHLVENSEASSESLATGNNPRTHFCRLHTWPWALTASLAPFQVEETRVVLGRHAPWVLRTGLQQRGQWHFQELPLFLTLEQPVREDKEYLPSDVFTF